MPAFANLSAVQRAGIAEYVLGGPDKELPGQAAPRPRSCPIASPGITNSLIPTDIQPLCRRGEH